MGGKAYPTGKSSKPLHLTSSAKSTKRILTQQLRTLLLIIKFLTMRFFFLAGVLPLMLLLVLGLPTNEALMPRQATTAQAESVYAGGGWIEVIAARSNGQLLLPHTNVPELWSLAPDTKTATKLLSFTGALGLTGITEISPDVFAVIAGNFSTRDTTVKAGSWAVWKVDFTSSNGVPQATRVKLVPESGFFIGVTLLNNNTILIADAGKGALYKMDITTGEYNVVLADKSMDRNGQLAGIHGLHYIDGYAYYTNTFGGGLWKLKVDSSGKASGTPTQVTALSRPEDFAIGANGTTYVGRMTGGITKVTADGKTSQFVGVQSPTGVIFGRGERNKDVLYISTTRGAILSATVK